MKITTMNKQAAVALGALLDANLQKFAAEHGLAVKLGNAKFDSAGVRFIGIEFFIEEAKEEKNLKNLEIWMRLGGLKKTESTRYSLVEYKSSRPMYPWVVKSKLDGKLYKITDEQAKMHFS